MRLWLAVWRRASGGLLAWLGWCLLYVTLLMTWLVSFLVFRVVNRTTVNGKSVGTLPRGTLVVSNHQSLIDSFLVGLVVYFPWLLWQPDRAPSHLADARNFMTHPVLRFVYRVLRVIPVGRNDRGERRDRGAFTAACTVLRQGGLLHVFIEGTRAKDDELLPPKPQVGALALDTGATVVPVYIRGMHRVHPYRKLPGDPPVTWWRRLFGSHTEWLLDIRGGQHIHVEIGSPITAAELDRLAGPGEHRERVTRVSQAIMDQLHRLRVTSYLR